MVRRGSTGHTVRLLVTPRMDGELSELLPDRIARRITDLIGAGAVARRAIVYQTQVLFVFLMTFHQGDGLQRLIPVMLDPETEEAVRPIDLSQTVAWPEPMPIAASPDGEAMEYRLLRLFEKAKAPLNRRIERYSRQWYKENRTQMRREIDRIRQYYAGLIAEQVEPLKKLIRRMAYAQVRADLSRTAADAQKYRSQLASLKAAGQVLEQEYEERQAALVAERERRIDEVRRRFHLQARVTLRQMALVLIPHIEWVVRHPSGRALVARYDCVRGRLAPQSCACCSARLVGEIHVCACGACACEQCHSVCPACTRVICADCAPGRCSACRDPLCAACCPVSERRGSDPPWVGLVLCGRCRVDLHAEYAAITGYAPDGLIMY